MQFKLRKMFRSEQSVLEKTSRPGRLDRISFKKKKPAYLRNPCGRDKRLILPDIGGVQKHRRKNMRLRQEFLQTRRRHFNGTSTHYERSQWTHVCQQIAYIVSRLAAMPSVQHALSTVLHWHGAVKLAPLNNRTVLLVNFSTISDLAVLLRSVHETCL